MAKNITKGAHVKSATTDSAVEIARHISAILKHPDTPVCLYTALGDAVNDLYVPQGYYNTVEHIAARLANTIREGKEN